MADIRVRITSGDQQSDIELTNLDETQVLRYFRMGLLAGAGQLPKLKPMTMPAAPAPAAPAAPAPSAPAPDPVPAPAPAAPVMVQRRPESEKTDVPPDKYRKSWTTKELEIVREQWKQGVSYHDIGVKLGRTERSVENAVYKLKLRATKSNLPENDRRSWTPSTLKRLMSMYKEGASFEQMIDTFGRTATAIQAQIYGLRKKGRFTGEVRPFVEGGQPANDPQPAKDEQLQLQYEAYNKLGIGNLTEPGEDRLIQDLKEKLEAGELPNLRYRGPIVTDKPLGYALAVECPCCGIKYTRSVKKYSKVNMCRNCNTPLFMEYAKDKKTDFMAVKLFQAK